MPISKCSKSSFWPILLSIVNIPILTNKVFPIGIYHSITKKPDSVAEFLNHFIADILKIIQNGIVVDEILFNFTITQIIYDAPAKAYILNVKSHMAYFGCNMCTEEGDYIHSMTFPGAMLNVELMKVSVVK